jgi:hypothetical protein
MTEKKITHYQEVYLREYADSKPMYQIAKDLGVSTAWLCAKAVSLNISPNYKPKYQKEELSVDGMFVHEKNDWSKMDLK